MASRRRGPRVKLPARDEQPAGESDSDLGDSSGSEAAYRGACGDPERLHGIAEGRPRRGNRPETGVERVGPGRRSDPDGLGLGLRPSQPAPHRCRRPVEPLSDDPVRSTGRLGEESSHDHLGGITAPWNCPWREQHVAGRTARAPCPSRPQVPFSLEGAHKAGSGPPEAAERLTAVGARDTPRRQLSFHLRCLAQHLHV